MTEREEGALAGSSPARRPDATPARRFSDEEVARILHGAAELQERSSGGSGSGGAPGRGLTLEDLRQVAAEVGIDARFVELAAARMHGPPDREDSILAGGAYSWAVHRTVPGEVPEEDRDRIVRAIRGVMGQKGEVEDVYGRMEWSYDDGLGPVLVGVASRDGATEIDVSARRVSEAGLWHGLGIPFGGIVGGAVVGGGILGMSGPVILLPVAAMGLVGWGGTRGLWSLLSRRWEAKLTRLADAVAAAAAEVAVMPPDGAAGQEREALPPGGG